MAGDEMNREEAPSGGKSINLSEDFRRAVRNSLLWSSLALVTGLGRPTGHDVNVSFLGAGLAFNPQTLSFGAALGAAYMFALFLRSKQRLLSENNHLAVEAKSAELRDLIALLIKDATSARGWVANARQVFETFPDEVGRQLAQFNMQVAALYSGQSRQTAVRELRTITEKIKPQLMGGEPPVDPNRIREHHQELLQNRPNPLSDDIKKQEKDVNDQIEKLAILLPKETEQRSAQRDQAVAQFDAATQRITETEDRLGRFHSDILRSEKRWYQTMDVAIPAAIFAIGFVLASARVIGLEPERWSYLNPPVLVANDRTPTPHAARNPASPPPGRASPPPPPPSSRADPA